MYPGQTPDVPFVTICGHRSSLFRMNCQSSNGKSEDAYRLNRHHNESNTNMTRETGKKRIRFWVISENGDFGVPYFGGRHNQRDAQTCVSGCVPRQGTSKLRKGCDHPIFPTRHRSHCNWNSYAWYSPRNDVSMSYSPFQYIHRRMKNGSEGDNVVIRTGYHSPVSQVQRKLCPW